MFLKTSCWEEPIISQSFSVSLPRCITRTVSLRAVRTTGSWEWRTCAATNIKKELFIEITRKNIPKHPRRWCRGVRTAVTCCVLWFYSSEMGGWVIFGVDFSLSVVCEVFCLLSLLFLHFRYLFYHIAQSNRERRMCFFKYPTWIIKPIKGQMLVLLPQDRCHLCTCNSENENTVIYVVLSASWISSELTWFL